LQGHDLVILTLDFLIQQSGHVNISPDHPRWRMWLLSSCSQ